MLGPAKPRRLDEPISVSLEDLVPLNNFSRQLEVKFDLSSVRGWVADRYVERGRPSIDPVICFKLQLVMFFEGIRSECKLIETDNLNHLLPDASAMPSTGRSPYEPACAVVRTMAGHTVSRYVLRYVLRK
jgi:hypothetical protein